MDNLLKSAAIVIPVYKKEPSELEKLSYIQCIKTLRNFDIYLVIPEDMEYNRYTQYGDVYIKKFPPNYFRGLQGYNKLLLSSFFYQEFTSYKYILIYQLDCFVFKDELEYWCSQNYDYVGAPWIGIDWFPRICKRITNFILKEDGLYFRVLKRLRWRMAGTANPSNLCVGNGGLSLRNVRKCIDATEHFKAQIRQWPFNEDYFFCIFLPLMSFKFDTPSAKEAAFFSFDLNPHLCYELTNKRLPFGCHGWHRNDSPYDNLRFWNPIVHDHLGTASA